MNINSFKSSIENLWNTSVIPTLKDYIRIPVISRGFAPDWKETRYLFDARTLVENRSRK